MTDGIAVGVDIGGTKARVALVGSDGSVLLVEETSTSTEGGADPGLARSVALADAVSAQARERGLEIEAVGVGVPEYVDAHGRLRSRDVIAWDRQPMEVFADLGPVVVESDVRCGALAESRAGAGVGLHSMLYASIGTGISCALVIGGRLWRGHRGEAIALGELPVDRALDPGSATTLEQFASGAAIARRYARVTGESVSGAREVISRADRGDSRAAAVVDSSALALGAALAWAVHLIDPERIVLGGGLGASGGHWAEVVREAYVERSRPHAPVIVPAALGGDSGAIGAGILALTRMDP
ncbi:MAG: ROK family protein [Actinobacteria bacterium]|nr:ROK family protein [Actinomycetota bacterium]